MKRWPALIGLPVLIAAMSARAFLFGGGTAVVTSPSPVGMGCSTAYFIDKDCDGYGVGVKTSGTYTLFDGSTPVGTPAYWTTGDKPDADDDDPTVRTTAEWQAKWGSNNAGMVNFLNVRKGFANTSRVFYVSQSGDDSTGAVNDPTHPYRTMAPIMTVLADLQGGAVIIRGGTWTDLNFNAWSQGNPGFQLSGTPTTPVYVMNYPGERVETSTPIVADTVYFPAPNVSSVAVDGLIITAADYGLSDGISIVDTDHYTFINNEFAGWHQLSIGNHTEDVLLQHNVMHDMMFHAVYMLWFGWTNPNPLQDFDYSNPNAQHRGKVLNNVLYSNGSGGYEPIHINTFGESILIDGNVISYSGGTPIAFMTGIAYSTISNNIMFANGRDCITFYTYTNDSAILHDNVVEHNSCYVTQLYDTVRGAATGGGVTMKAEPGAASMRDNTVRNNIFVYDNGSPDWGAQAFNFQYNTFPEHWTITNNVFQNTDVLAGPSDRFATMTSDACPSGTCTPGTYNFAQFSAVYPTGNLYTDPMFVAASPLWVTTPERFDLHLRTGSPAIPIPAGAFNH